jgi:hypothetical protein
MKELRLMGVAFAPSASSKQMEQLLIDARNKARWRRCVRPARQKSPRPKRPASRSVKAQGQGVTAGVWRDPRLVHHLRLLSESNLVPLVGTLTTAEQGEGLRLLNNLVLSVMGSEVGRELTDIQIGGGFDQAGLCTRGCRRTCA